MAKSVCIVTGTFHPDVGGPTTYLMSLARQLVERGHRIAVITYGEEAPHLTYAYPVVRVSRRFSPLARLIVFTYQVLRIARSYDVLYVLDYGLPAVIANLVLRKRLVMKVVGDFAWEYCTRKSWIEDSIDEFQERRYGSLRVEFMRRLRNFYLFRASAVIVPSQYLRRLLERMGVATEKIHLIPNAVEEAAVVDGAGLRRAGTNPLALTVARLAPWKGVSGVIEALATLDRRIDLLVVGDGPERSRLERLARGVSADGRVVFAGELAPDEVARWLRTADIFILNSTYEGLSHALLEALRAEIPVITTRVGGNPEVIEHGVNGVLIEPGDLAAMKAWVTRILDSEGLRATFARNGRLKLKQFDWATVFEETERLLEGETDEHEVPAGPSITQATDGRWSH